MPDLTFDGDVLRTQLYEHGFALIEHGISNDLIEEGIASYANFTDNYPDPEPATLNAMMVNPTKLDVLDRSVDNQTQWHKYRTNHDQFAKPGGYSNRWLQAEVLKSYDRKVYDKATDSMITLVEDPKEFFHIHPSGISKMNQLSEEYNWGTLPPEVYELHDIWVPIHRLAFMAMKKVMYLLEETHPELISKYATPKDISGSPLRINWYYPNQSDILAGGHTDKGLGTIQVAESHVGFRARKPGHDSPEEIEHYNQNPLADPNMILLERSASLGIYFPALALKNKGVYPSSKLQPLWHDVIYSPKFNDGRSVVGEKCGRWSVIAFHNSESAGEVPKSQTHDESTSAVA